MNRNVINVANKWRACSIGFTIWKNPDSSRTFCDIFSTFTAFMMSARNMCANRAAPLPPFFFLFCVVWIVVVVVVSVCFSYLGCVRLSILRLKLSNQYTFSMEL